MVGTTPHTMCAIQTGRHDATRVNSSTDRPSETPHKDRIEKSQGLRSREDLFDTIRLSRRIDGAAIDQTAGIASFPTSVILGNQVVDVFTSLQPGIFAPGVHRITARIVVHGVVITGEFAVAVGDAEPTAATWSAHAADGSVALVPADVLEQLPTSIQVRAMQGAALRGAVRRVHLAAEMARTRLMESNRGLVRTVVNRYRSVVRTEATSLELDDLMLVGEHQMLDTADRFFTDPTLRPVRDVAWSKLVQRAVGNAIRSEIARATGISVEFRQLLSWFHAHPEDRSLPVDVVAQRMAVSAGVTRLMSQRALTRTAAEALLEDMLATGDAMYVEPGRDAAARAKDMRADGVFVISPRSSHAEIDRARKFQGAHSLTLDDAIGDDEHGATRIDRMGSPDVRFDETDNTDFLRRTIAQTGMSKVEALVWLHRTGALDPTGQAVELPEIAESLGLEGRSEARAALRRARRKLDTWMVGAEAAELAS